MESKIQSIAKSPTDPHTDVWYFAGAQGFVKFFCFTSLKMTRGLGFDTSDKELFLLLWVKHAGFKLTLNEANKYKISFNLLRIHYISCLLSHNTALLGRKIIYKFLGHCFVF